MLGAIAGDVIGSIYERRGIRSKEFPLFGPANRFTDDTVLTCAVADRLLHGGDYVPLFHDYFHRYPNAGYGGTFIRWAFARVTAPYGSYGNGSAMRVSAVGLACDTLAATMAEAQASAAVTHDHPEGIRGAQATAAAIFLARTGHDKAAIRDHVTREFGYDLSLPLAVIRETYAFDVTCQGSVPQSIVAFLESEDYEDAVRNAISLAGDADTMACIAGGIAEAFYGGVPEHVRQPTLERLDPHLRRIVAAFYDRFGDRLAAHGRPL
ncbi:MAG: ADP-ribosylglycohydrolase family protein [Planctomycetia bacterium]